ncbi:exodeoxyribonuclease VII large subunit, partial [Rhodopseudomonas sp. BR0C11]|uniref:exodeoxyribonuclease VII large subunit n=1 Tax=Rhodopseudomonas sp. BR0C11 TaxID=2269370 RepID=UPI001EC5603A
RLDNAAASLPRALRANTHAHHRRFAAAAAGMTLKVLRAQVAHSAHRLDSAGTQLQRCARATLRHRRERFEGLAVRLQASKLANQQAQRMRIAREQERLERLAERARRALITLLERRQARVDATGKLLTALSYRGVLARGFALVRDADGRSVHAAASVAAGARLSVEFADGRVAVTADGDSGSSAEATKPAATPAKPAKRPASPAGQGSLF